MRRDPNSAPIFPSHWGLCVFRRLLSHLHVSHILTRPTRFNAPFSCYELDAALSKCRESAPSADCLPCSLLKVSFPWWRLLSFFNLVLRFAVACSLVVLIIKREVVPLLSTPVVPSLSPFHIFRAPRPPSHCAPSLDATGPFQRGFHWGRHGLQSRGLLAPPPP